MAEPLVTCVDIEGNTHMVPCASLQWRPSAYGIVLRDKKVLLCKHYGKFNLPGGGVDLGEKLEAALSREVQEETGIIIANPRLLGADTDFFRLPYEDTFVQSILLYYLCDYAGGELSADGLDEHEKQYAELSEWIPLQDIDTLEITSSKDFRRFIKQAEKTT
ncbi:MAG: NUDIX domain-containing protein [Patescibacteria group bacterium]